MPAPHKTWDVLRQYGPADAFHQRVPHRDTGHEVWIRTIPRPALVLGSTQPMELIRHTRAAADGIEVCKRRSGGGLVWINPETDVWIDVIVPADSPRWSPDIGRSFHWLGEVWAETLRQTISHTAGLATDTVQVTRGGGPRTPAGALWCYADLGHGEVTVGDAKVVGLSQRRTRTWARLQGLMLGRWPGAALADYVDMEVASSLSDNPDLVPLDPSNVAAGLPAEVDVPDPRTVTDTFLRLLTET